MNLGAIYTIRQECLDAVRDVASLELADRLKVAFDIAANSWAKIGDGDRLAGAVAAVHLLATVDERAQLEAAIAAIHAPEAGPLAELSLATMYAAAKETAQ